MAGAVSCPTCGLLKPSGQQLDLLQRIKCHGVLLDTQMFSECTHLWKNRNAPNVPNPMCLLPVHASSGVCTWRYVAWPRQKIPLPNVWDTKSWVGVTRLPYFPNRRNPAALRTDPNTD